KSNATNEFRRTGPFDSTRLELPVRPHGVVRNVSGQKATLACRGHLVCDTRRPACIDGVYPCFGGLTPRDSQGGFGLPNLNRLLLFPCNFGKPTLSVSRCVQSDDGSATRGMP